MSILLDEKAIKEKWESTCTDLTIDPDSPFAFELEIAHAQARAICTAIEEADQSGSTPRQSRIAILRLIRQLEAELREGK
jgi:hypothetical protein